ncbi:GGDEF domain-containing protein [Methylorubrum sp. SB2]|uniref:GGDEF domain-containing protein n=1 Tax=Methylorubrum subtropicum TaxID=3138812 RepID=UPI00313E7CB1
MCATTVVLSALFQRELIRRKAAQQTMAVLNAELRQLATMDALTGLGNRRQFDEILARECRRAARVGKPLSLLMLDADHFKSFNDRYGHQQGDQALKLIADAMQTALRASSDTAYRIGGEEFAVVLPDTEQASAETVADRLRQAVLGQWMPHAGNPHGLVTISCGVAVLSTGSSDGAAALIAAADKALYEAKRQGRNRVQTAVSTPNQPPYIVLSRI